MFNSLYKEESIAQKGTLIQLHSKFRRTNVRKNPKKAVNACSQFIDLTTRGYLVLAAMEYLELSDRHGTPTGYDPAVSKQKYFDDVAYGIVDRFIFGFKNPLELIGNHNDLDVTPKPPEAVIEHGYCQGRPKCGHPGCDREFVKEGPVAQRHRRNCQFKVLRDLDLVEDDENEHKSRYVDETDDYKYNYTTKALRKGMFCASRHDAMKEGDGKRMLAHWKTDFLSFKAGHHTNYSILAFELVSKLEATLSEREAHQLTHNRFVNMYGGAGNNISLDLALEFLNKEVKPHLKNVTRLTDQVVERAGKFAKICREVVHNFDERISFYSAIGRHKENTYDKEVGLMVEDLYHENLFKIEPSRSHNSFKKCKRFDEFSLNPLDLKKWMIEQKVKCHKRERYSSIVRGIPQ